MSSKKIIFIVGPTAVGKSQAAFHLAEAIQGEIISCDSMQVYKGVSIVTNHPPGHSLLKIPHHLLGIIPLEKSFDVAVWQKKAITAIKDIHKRGKIPIVAGGSGLYMAILLDGLFAGSAKDAKLRGWFERRIKEEGLESLFRELSEIDPAAAAKIHPNDARRIIRALEVFSLSQKPISQLQKQREGLWGHYDIKIFALNCDRHELYQRIEERVEKMFQQGLVEEIRGLKNHRLSLTAAKIIGIAEVRGMLNGEYDIKEAKALMKLHTRRYAKRQLTWFRKDKRLTWITLDSENSLQNTALRIKKMIGEN